jgi:hypothetical protein
VLSLEDQVERSPSVLKFLAVAATTVLAIALISCSTRETSAVDSPSPMTYEPSSPVARAPLAPPVGYSSPSLPGSSATPFASHADPSSSDFESPTAALGTWQASPRWGAVKGEGCIEVEQDPQARYRVESCSKGDNGETP